MTDDVIDRRHRRLQFFFVAWAIVTIVRAVMALV